MFFWSLKQETLFEQTEMVIGDLLLFMARVVRQTNENVVRVVHSEYIIRLERMM